MSLLLDTHVLLWAVAAPTQLGKRTRERLLDPGEQLFVSAISSLEIARLASLGQVELASPVQAWCERARRALNATSVVVDEAIAVEAYALPGDFHPDPADRLLVATARVLGLQIVTADKRILAYRAVRSVNAKR